VLDELHISGLGVIEDAELRLSPGLTVITGETGAGKTMVVTALELLLGARADSSLVRAGASAARAEARVVPVPQEAVAGGWVDEDATELVVSREIPADGRSRARIDGRLAPVSALAEVLGAAVEVHAQHEHVGLTRPEVQRALLDRYAGDPHARALAAYVEAHTAWREAVRRRDELAADTHERARTVDRLRFEVAEIDGAALDLDADTALPGEVEVLEHAEELQVAVARAAAALGEDGVGEPLGVAVDALRRLPVDDPRLSGLRDRLETVAEEVADLVGDLRDAGEQLDADPARLEQLRSRVRVIGDLQRKYGSDVAEMLAYADRARAELERLEADETDAAALDERVERLRAELEARAADVTRGRTVAAERLAEAVDGHLADLAMPHARFSVAVEPDEPGPTGADRVTFLLAANPGEPARPVGTAASGGERSRVALAVEVALADVADARVLVFDEVDAGIGGATAMAVGEKLARLARGGSDGRPRQVLCVTHLAQLAAFADVHHVVEKGLADGRTVTTTRQVAEDERVGELSRMLGGDATRTTGLEHARDLLAEAAERRAS
jgi:DNA repair protein RecN (Recombination protein N)